MAFNPALKPGATLLWSWIDADYPPGTGSDYKVEIVNGQIEWNYYEDRWGRNGRQSFADFAEFGPLWDAPQNVLDELIAQFELKDLPWRRPGYAKYSPAYRAILRREEQEAIALFEPSDANRRYHAQRTLLMEAAAKSATHVVERLIAMGADTDARDEYGGTALRDACNSVETMRLLLDHGADVNSTDENLRTPLIVFCSTTQPNLEGLQLLLKWSANVNVRDIYQKSAKDCLRGNHPELATLLRQSGAS